MPSHAWPGVEPHTPFVQLGVVPWKVIWCCQSGPVKLVIHSVAAHYITHVTSRHSVAAHAVAVAVRQGRIRSVFLWLRLSLSPSLPLSLSLSLFPSLSFPLSFPLSLPLSLIASLSLSLSLSLSGNHHTARFTAAIHRRQHSSLHSAGKLPGTSAAVPPSYVQGIVRVK